MSPRGDPSGADINWRFFFRHKPDIDHIGVGYGNTAIGPVPVPVTGFAVLWLVGLPVNHDLAARVDTLGPRASDVLLIRVGDMQR